MTRPPQDGAEPSSQPGKEGESCPACAKLIAAYDRLDARMASRGNFGIVPLPRLCKEHRKYRIEKSPVPVVPWRDYGNPRQG